MGLTFNLRLFVYLFLGFILATVVGTVSHEAGHYFAAKHFGYPATLHYAMVSYGNMNFNDKRIIFLDSLYKQHKDKISAKEASLEKEYFKRNSDSIQNILKKDKMYLAKRDRIAKEHFVSTLWGPLQTMITGTIGFIYLYINRNGISIKRLNLKNWFFVFLALFWSRQVLNCTMWLLYYWIAGHISYRGDEAKMSHYLNLPIWTINAITAIVGTIILAWTFFKIIPVQQRLTFILAGIAGSAAGWHLWMNVAGPAILP